MTDQSYLDKKTFIDTKSFNCSFCNRNHVMFNISAIVHFNWDNSKECYAIFVNCCSCKNTSMHLSFNKIAEYVSGFSYLFDTNINIDSEIFYSVPTTFFGVDDRLPKVLRELINESESCLKMNFLTGASACMRKAVYEFLVLEKATGDRYEDRIKSLKSKYTNTDPDLFDILSSIQQMTSDKIHEQSWDKWNSKHLTLIIETLKTILYELYVIPKIKEERKKNILDLKQKASAKDKK
jgi:transcription elongation factor Elf1